MLISSQGELGFHVSKGTKGPKVHKYSDRISMVLQLCSSTIIVTQKGKPQISPFSSFINHHVDCRPNNSFSVFKPHFHTLS